MEPVKNRHWKIRECDPFVVDRLAGELALPPILARLLVNRGIDERVLAERFLSSTLAAIHDPFLLSGMDRAVERLSMALHAGETVCVYGDYDVDGVAATALLISFFRAIGMTCFYHIPNRIDDGYGLSADGIRKIADAGASVIVTVDCGISALEEASFCASLGIDLIITDHHMPGPVVPSACAVINPLQPGCRFPFKALAGVGVAFNLMIALRSRLRGKGFFNGRATPNLREYLDLVALGTIADVVPLADENRIFVKYGLKELTAAARPGVRALKEAAGVTGDVGYGAVGFRLAPRINAAGRLEDAALGVELLLEKEWVRAVAMAADLNENNAARQALEREMLDDALAMVRGNPAMRGRKSIVLASEEWHPGVIGIVAARIVDTYHRPTVLISLREGSGKGSGRSIPGFHLHDALKACSDHLEKFGGHRHAAGLTIDEAMLESFVGSFEAIASGLLDADDLTPVLSVDAELLPEEINLELVDALSMLEPFGMGNPEPLFVARGMEVLERRILKEQHLKLTLRSGDLSFDAIGFAMAGKTVDCNKVDIVFSPGVNRWNGRTTLQLRLKDIRGEVM